MPTETRSTAPPSKAGRNLPHAIAVGVGLGAVVIASLIFHKEFFLLVMAAAVLVGAWELARALGKAGIRVSIVPLAIGAVGMIAGGYLRGGEALVIAFGLTVIASMIWRVADGARDAVPDIAGSVLVATYPCFVAGFVALMLAEEQGHLRIFFFVLVTVCSDIGGYAVGVLFGKHPMAPTVSPKKSWEGFGGSVFFCALVGAVAIVLMFDAHWWAGAIIGAATAAAATAGDLVESLIKRDLGIKDMGSLLPGHGGVMDRLDSLVVTAPIIWALLHLFLTRT